MDQNLTSLKPQDQELDYFIVMHNYRKAAKSRRRKLLRKYKKSLELARLRSKIANLPKKKLPSQLQPKTREESIWDVLQPNSLTSKGAICSLQNDNTDWTESLKLDQFSTPDLPASPRPSIFQPWFTAFQYHSC